MSKTKEEILATKNWSTEYPNYMAENNIHDAMDEHSRQQATAFAEWTCVNLWSTHGGVWYPYQNEDNPITSEQLYDLFIQSEKNKQS